MSAHRIDIFFYGLFMDPEALPAKGSNPFNVRQACVQGMALRLGKRAALAVSPGSVTYGIAMALTHAEIEQLYSEPSVAMYRPEAVIVQFADGSQIAALCLNLPIAPDPGEANPSYAASLRSLGEKLGLPARYIASVDAG
jgi:hypothetical protein